VVDPETVAITNSRSMSIYGLVYAPP
jgi:hypothetical protein